MDKNKSAYKLDSITPILWLNLDADEHRRQHMESQFDYWQITNHTRISGFDGRKEDITDSLKGRVPDNMSMNEIGCCMSHLKAIKYFIEETDYPEVLILEDDILFETVRHWRFAWKEMYSRIPYDYDTVQLTTINPATVYINMHPRFINDFSAAAYLITRHHATKIYKNHIKGNKYRLDNGVKPRAVSEDLILNTGKSYCFPIFLYRLDLGSAIHPEHIDIYHKDSYAGIYKFWTHDAANLPDDSLDALMNWHPYEFGLPPGFDVNGPIRKPEQ